MKEKNCFLTLFLAGALALAFLPLPGCRERDAVTLLYEINLANQKIDYSGEQIFSIYSGESGREYLSVVQDVCKTGPDKFLVTAVRPLLDNTGGGAAPSSAETGKIRFSTDEPPDFFMFFTDQSKSIVTFSNLDLLLDNYAPSLQEGETMVAGRETVQLHLDPIRKDRSSFFLWVDKEKKIVLQLEERNYDGSLLLQYSFQSIDFRPSVPQENTAARNVLQSPFKDAGTLEDLDFTYYLPSEPPAGYEIRETHVIENEGEKCLVIVLSDGIKELYVFEFVKKLTDTIKTLHGGAAGVNQGTPLQVLYREFNNCLALSSLCLAKEDTIINILGSGFRRDSLIPVLEWTLY